MPNAEYLFLLPNLPATEALAGRLAPLLCKGEVVALQGDLGAGKTTFARALLKELGVEGEVPSPTFTLVQSYDGRAFPVYHFDLYRLKKPEEMEEIGFDDACADGLVLVEWPERAPSFLPRDYLAMQFTMDQEGQRQVTLVPRGAWQARLEGFCA